MAYGSNNADRKVVSADQAIGLATPKTFVRNEKTQFTIIITLEINIRAERVVLFNPLTNGSPSLSGGL